MRSLFQNISHSLSLYTPHKVLQRSQLTNPLGALLRNFFQGLVPRVWGLSLGTCFHFSPVSWTRIAMRLYLLLVSGYIKTVLMRLRNVLAIILALCTRFNRETDRWSGAEGRPEPQDQGALTDQPGGHLPTQPSCSAFLTSSRASPGANLQTGVRVSDGRLANVAEPAASVRVRIHRLI